jgi:hypothetical protein
LAAQGVQKLVRAKAGTSVPAAFTFERNHKPQVGAHGGVRFLRALRDFQHRGTADPNWDQGADMRSGAQTARVFNSLGQGSATQDSTSRR